ncbi:MAG: hypothetical protein M3417_16695 [Actinomycetota bacterium]|nr:hypothetical protein [Actinomycetota bacterium]
MRPRCPTAAVLLACACAVLSVGCGGGAEEKNAYVEDVQAAQRTFVTRFEQVRKRLTTTSTLAQDQATLASFETITQRFATALEKVQPPEVVRAEHGRLVAAVAGYGADVGRARSQLRAASTEDRSIVRTQLSSSVAGTQEKIAKAVGDINAAIRE